MKSILVQFHCRSNTGYAIDTYEKRFFEMALDLVGGASDIHIAYPDTSAGISDSLPRDFQNVIEFDPTTDEDSQQRFLEAYVRENDIDFVFGIDQPVRRPWYRRIRQAGVEGIVSYWGAQMSSIFSGVPLMLRKVDVRLAPNSPEHYVFESRAMARTAVRGRGISEDRVSVVYPGVDVEQYSPGVESDDYLARHVDIDPTRKTIVYSGHFEERKGVDVLLRAAVELADDRGREDFHLLLLGDRAGEAERLEEIVSGKEAASHVTFGGYRDDLSRIFPHCDIGAIASTGWDSFPASALEMASCGLPLLVSELQGLVETIDEGTTGYTFPPGDHCTLADRIEELLDEPDRRARMGRAARRRIDEEFTIDRQIDELARICRSVYG